MKKALTFKSILIATLAYLLISTSLIAQAPQKMSYQAVIRDNNSQLVSNKKVGMQISILQGSASSSPVYEETQTPTSNDNGLVSIEIGDGNVQTGDFTKIDWTNGPFYIKTETDPSGGASYSINGTSQLLSVPYALHAKTADSVIGAITYTAGTGIAIDSGNIVSATGGSDLAIGDSYQGGIIFWLDTTRQHGLIVTDSDQSTGIEWNNGTFDTTNAVRDGIRAGKFNTERIIANQGTGAYAAQICANYQGGNYGDWYLPSTEELNQMYLNKAVIDSAATSKGGVSFSTTIAYWGSTESSPVTAYSFLFMTGKVHNYIKAATYFVRAVRAF